MLSVAEGSNLQADNSVINLIIYHFSVRANEGDAYPLGALPINTQIHCLEKNPGQPFHLITAAGTYGTILRKFDEHVVVQVPSKKQFAFHQTCMATVGRTKAIFFFDFVLLTDL